MTTFETAPPPLALAALEGVEGGEVRETGEVRAVVTSPHWDCWEGELGSEVSVQVSSAPPPAVKYV